MKTQRIFHGLAVIAAIAMLSACASIGSPSISKTTQNELAEEARISLEELYATSPEARDLRKHAKAVLVFPDIFKAGLIFGGSGGNGVMLSPSGRVMGYYNASSVSYGLQAGAQSFSETMFMMTDGAIKYLDSSSGWSVGTGPSVVVVDEGGGKDFSSTTLRDDVYAFIYGQEGLMAGIGIQGQKITKLESRK